MLDAHMRPLIDPPLNRLSRILSQWGVSANSVTLMGFALGLGAMVSVGFEAYSLGFVFLILNRLCDGLDGGIARQKGVTDFGGFLDILCDFIIYAGLVFAFALANPENAFWAAFLIFSFIGPITSFLAYAIIAAKKERNSTRQGSKSFYYLDGLCEGTETFLVLGLVCLFPGVFPIIAFIYGVMCWVTTLGRGLSAWRDFRE